jgi:hypothetical protein
MNRMQKISWLMVICIGTAVLLSAVSVGTIYLLGLPCAGTGMAFLGIAGIGGLGPILFKKDPGPVQMDERDREIVFKAHRASMAISYLVFGALCMGIWAAYYFYLKIETISVHILPNVYLVAGITAFFSNALMTLILYGRDKTSEGETK